MTKATAATIAVILLLAGVGGGLAFWKYRSSHAANAGAPAFEPSEAVEVVAVRTMSWRPTASLSGTVIALQSVTLSNEVAGTVREVLFESGAIVNEGQVLLKFDTTTEEADLRAIEATVQVIDAEIRSAEADRTLAEANLRRLTQAVESRAVSESEMDQARSRLDSAAAQLERSRAARAQALARVDQMKSTIDKKTLRAPFKAVAGLRNIHPGQYLAEGSTVVGLQSVSDNIYLDFALPQEHAARAKVGMVVLAEAPMLGKEPLRIEVVAIDAVANPTTRNIRVRAIVPNPGLRLRPGMFVDIVAPLGESIDYVSVPLTAPRRSSFGDQVFVITPDPQSPDKLRARQRFVRLGPTLGGDIAVLDGLKPGEEIAADGSFKLRDNALVTRGKPVEARHDSAAGEPKAADRDAAQQADNRSGGL